MSNTQKRVFFGILLAGLTLGCLVMGRDWTLGGLAIFSLFALDEIFCHFFLGRRFSLSYFGALAIFLLPFVYLNFVDASPGLMSVFYNAGLLMNLVLLAYLFIEKFGSKHFLKFGEKLPYLASFMVLFPAMSLSSLFDYGKWGGLIGGLLFINFGMDTGAWFFGKKFGKHKLWESVSPNKTIEGLIGGAFSSGLLGLGVWLFFFEKVSLKLFILFTFLGALSHMGDLVQSKLKRQRGIKDSSNLIPGHGGAYDRIDSLIFLAPFYAAVVKYIL